MIRKITSTILLLFLSTTALAADAPVPRASYALHLVATPSAAFPFLDRLGRVEIAIYPQGVRAESPWLSGYVRKGTDSVRLENPTLRLYSDASFASLREIFTSLRPDDEEEVAVSDLEIRKTGRKGTIGKLPASCYRIILGETAWIDIWTTSAVEENEVWKKLQAELLGAISPELSKAARRIPGTVLHVVVNTRRFPEKTILATKEVYLSSAGNEEALQTGRFFLRAPSLDRLVK